MGGTSIWHWLVVGVIVMLLFGRGKLSELMGDAAKGIKAFKKGMADEDAPTTTTTTTTSTTEPVRIIEHQTPVSAAPGAGSTTTSASAGGAALGERKAG
jgi:sec-independent protein translocase protein TatA